MSEQDRVKRKQESDQRSTRRSFIRGTAVSASFLGSIGIGSAAARQNTKDHQLEDFRVKGKQTTRIKIKPNIIEYKITKTSPDLNKRYGFGTIQETEIVERLNPEEDGLPKRAPTEVTREKWDSHWALSDEWRELQKVELESERGGNIQSHTDWDWPSGIPTYYHKPSGSGWEMAAPINLLADGNDASELAQHIDEMCSTPLNGWATMVAQKDRYMLINGSYIKQHASVASEAFGVRGRTHARIWNHNNSYLCVGAHIDDEHPHEAIAYEEAEERIMRDVSGANDRYFNGFTYYKDHDGHASKIYGWY